MPSDRDKPVMKFCCYCGQRECFCPSPRPPGPPDFPRYFSCCGARMEWEPHREGCSRTSKVRRAPKRCPACGSETVPTHVNVNIYQLYCSNCGEKSAVLMDDEILAEETR